MKFGVREICDVVLKRKTGGYFGKLYLDKGMPVMYFDKSCKGAVSYMELSKELIDNNK